MRCTSVGNFGGNLKQDVVLHVSLYRFGHCVCGLGGKARVCVWVQVGGEAAAVGAAELGIGREWVQMLSYCRRPTLDKRE